MVVLQARAHLGIVGQPFDHERIGGELYRVFDLDGECAEARRTLRFARTVDEHPFVLGKVEASDFDVFGALGRPLDDLTAVLVTQRDGGY